MRNGNYRRNKNKEFTFLCQEKKRTKTRLQASLIPKFYRGPIPGSSLKGVKGRSESEGEGKQTFVSWLLGDGHRLTVLLFYTRRVTMCS